MVDGIHYLDVRSCGWVSDNIYNQVIHTKPASFSAACSVLEQAAWTCTPLEPRRQKKCDFTEVCKRSHGLLMETLHSSVNSEIPLESLKRSVNRRQLSRVYLNLLNSKSPKVAANTDNSEINQSPFQRRLTHFPAPLVRR